MNGIFAVNKPRNWTSFDVVNKVRGTLGKKLREENPSLTPKQCRLKVRAHAAGGSADSDPPAQVGHGGTLDPDATGVLVHQRPIPPSLSSNGRKSFYPIMPSLS